MKIYIVMMILVLIGITCAIASDVPKVPIVKLAESFNFAEPGLYEVISPYTGNIIYIFREQGGDTKIQAINVNKRN